MRHPNGGKPGTRRSLQTFGRDLREARRRAGLSQRAVAQRLGVSQSYVSLVERGLRDPPLGSMGAFARPSATNLPSHSGRFRQHQTNNPS